METFVKIKKAISEGRFFKTVQKKIYPYIKGFFLFFSLDKKKIKIYTAKLNQIDRNDLVLAERIFKSFKLIKNQQESKSSLYKPSSLWQSLIDKDFNFLVDSFKKNDVEKFLYFLQNFGNWDKYLGIENQTLVKKYSKNIFLRNFLREEIFGGQLKLWKFFNHKKDLKFLNMPKHGNQIGATIDGNFVVIGSFSNQFYAEILSKYLSRNKKNIMMDVGGGYGKLGYYMMKNNQNLTFIDFDIPETLVLASFYLSKCFPNKKNLFYGEKDLDEKVLDEYDLIFLPPWEIENIGKDKIDLAINKNSLGEMEPDVANNYIEHIHKTSRFFFSMNHEYIRNKFNNEKKSLLNSEYDIEGKFKELIRYPDLSHMIYENNKVDYDSDIFFYIYEKK
jgi:putative sugar O-methyltransferase